MRHLVTPGVLLALLCTVAPLPATAQAPGGPGNTVYLEILGNGGLYSLNYERRFTDQLSAHAGVASWTALDLWSDAETSLTTLPLGVSFLPGSGTRRLELGAGLLMGARNRSAGTIGTAQSDTFVSLTGVLGYRYQPAQRGWMFRAGFTPFFGLNDEDTAYPDTGFLPSIGVSVGYSF